MNQRQRPTTARPAYNYKEINELKQQDNVLSKQIGQCLANFQILTELGKGSYGTVYKVKSYIDDKIYVIKKINLIHLKPKQQNEALNEAQILRKLRHPNIIRYFVSFIENDCLCIIMEYAEGGDLQQVTKIFQCLTQVLKEHKEKQKQISEQTIWTMAQELAYALQHIHQNNIIHRDIKTLNIFLTKDKRIKLGDLGVSKIFNSDIALQGTRVGTPLYLSPELIQYLPYDFKVDVWAYGCVIFHLAALETPFSGDNLINLGYNIVNKPPKPLPTIFSQKLNGLVSKSLEKLSALRPTIFDIVREYFSDTHRDTPKDRILNPNQHRIVTLIQPENTMHIQPVQRPFSSNPTRSQQQQQPKNRIFDQIKIEPQIQIANYIEENKQQLATTEKLKRNKKEPYELLEENIIKSNGTILNNPKKENNQSTDKIFFSMPKIELHQQPLLVQESQIQEPLILRQQILQNEQSFNKESKQICQKELDQFQNKEVGYKPYQKIKQAAQIRPLSAQARCMKYAVSQQSSITAEDINKDKLLPVGKLLTNKNMFIHRNSDLTSVLKIQLYIEDKDIKSFNIRSQNQDKNKFTIFDLNQNLFKAEKQEQKEKETQKESQQIIEAIEPTQKQGFLEIEITNLERSNIISGNFSTNKHNSRVQSAIGMNQPYEKKIEIRQVIHKGRLQNFHSSKYQQGEQVYATKKYTLKDLIEE